MGIKNLMNLLKEKAPNAIKQLDLKTYTGRSVACDASMVDIFFNLINKLLGNIPIFDINSTY